MTISSNNCRKIALFDLGHGECRLLVLDRDLRSFTTFATKMVGYAKGKVTGSYEFSKCLRALLHDAGLLDTRYKAILNISDLHTRYIVKSLQHRTSGTYSSNDFRSIIDSAIDTTTSELDEVIDAGVISAKLDDSVLNILSFGRAGRSIDIQLMLATHPKLILADIISGMNAAGVEVSEFRANGLGLSRTLKYLRPEAENAVLLDFGQCSSTGAVMIGGQIQKIFSIPVGSHHITRDIMAGLDCDEHLADTLKRHHGLSSASINSDVRQAVYMQRFLRPRVSEMLSLVGKNFAMYSRALDGGMLFCGGGAQLVGLADLTAKAFNCNAPFICQLSKKNIELYLGLSSSGLLDEVGSSWLSLFSHGRAVLEELAAHQAERDDRPLSRLRPLWTWLSELSR